MRKGARELMLEYAMLAPGDTVLCAVSGGADSMCLLHFLAEQSGPGGFSVVAAHYNHGLRGPESDRDEAFVAEWCRARAIPCYTERGDVRDEARRRKKGLEETGRLLRYDFLRRTAGRIGAGRIATAHTADDNAETLLLHLARGAGLVGLAGIAPRRGALIRPLLTTTRAEVEAYLSAHGVPHVEDGSNTDPAFARNRLRAEVIPVLRALNPRFVERTVHTQRVLRQSRDYLAAQAERATRTARDAGGQVSIEAARIAAQPAALAPLAAQRLITKAGGGPCAAKHLDALVALARGRSPSAELDLPGGLTAHREYERLVVGPREGTRTFAPRALVPDGLTVLEGTGWFCLCRAAVMPEGAACRPDHFYLRPDVLEGGAWLRPRRAGDAITLPGRGRKTLKKLFVEAAVPRRRREEIPVLAAGGRVLAVGRFGPDAAALPRPGEPALELILQEKSPKGEAYDDER